MRVDLEYKALDVRPGGEPDLLQTGAALNVARPVAEGVERAKMPDVAVDAPSGDVWCRGKWGYWLFVKLFVINPFQNKLIVSEALPVETYHSSLLTRAVRSGHVAKS